MSGLAFECSGSVASSSSLHHPTPSPRLQLLARPGSDHSIPDSRRVSLLDVPHSAPSLSLWSIHQVLMAHGKSGSVTRVPRSCCFLLEKGQKPALPRAAAGRMERRELSCPPGPWQEGKSHFPAVSHAAEPCLD